MSKKGFTLIELLVVIAIIGILSGIVLVSLRGTRIRARDARIQSDMGQIRSMAELVYTADDSYSGLCAADNTLNQAHATYGSELGVLENDVNTQNGGAGVPACYASASHFCVSATLASGGTICVSDAGRIGNDTCSAPDTTCD